LLIIIIVSVSAFASICLIIIIIIISTSVFIIIGDCWKQDYISLGEMRTNLEFNLNSYYDLIKENVALTSNYRLLCKRLEIVESKKNNDMNLSSLTNDNLKLKEELTTMDKNFKILESLLNEEKIKNANLLLKLNAFQSNENNQIVMLQLVQSEAHIEQLNNELKSKQDELNILNNEKRFLVLNQLEQFSKIQTSTEKINELQNKCDYYKLLAEKSIQKSGLLALENERLISILDQYKNEKEDSAKKSKRILDQKSKQFEMVDLTRIEEKVSIKNDY